MREFDNNFDFEENNDLKEIFLRYLSYWPFYLFNKLENYIYSNMSAFITLFQAEIKSVTNLSLLSFCA